MKSLSLFLTTALMATTVLAAPQTVTLSVPGMTCAACPITVKRALFKVEGVQEVNISYPERRAEVRYDDAQTNVQALIQAVSNTGYQAELESENDGS